MSAAAKAMDYDLSPDPMPEEVSFIRSDQYSFVLQGVPAVDVEDGVKSTDPKVNGLEVVKKWLVTRYHTPLDNMDQPMISSPPRRFAHELSCRIRSRSASRCSRRGTREISSAPPSGPGTQATLAESSWIFGVGALR